MKRTIYLLILIVFPIFLSVNAVAAYSVRICKYDASESDTLTAQIDSVIKQIFYNLPLEKSRLELREVILSDKRFISTDSIFNDYQPSSFFKGKTTSTGVVESAPDSIQILLAYGHTSLATEKGGEPDFKNIVLLNCQYFYSSQDSVEKEFNKLMQSINPILPDSRSEKSESPYSIGQISGQMKIIGNIFENFNPYYRIGISSISMLSDSNQKSIYVLDIVFSKEDK